MVEHFQAQSLHRQSMEQQALDVAEWDQRAARHEAKLGQVFGFVAVMGVLAIIGYAIHRNMTVVASTL